MQRVDRMAGAASPDVVLVYGTHLVFLERQVVHGHH